MTPFPHFVEINAPVRTAGEMMDAHQIHHLPVMSEGKLVSVVTNHDIQLARQGPADARVRDICVRKTYVVELSEPLDRVLQQMAERHLGSALVVKDGKLVGIFTISDACRAFCELLRALFPGGDDRVA